MITLTKAELEALMKKRFAELLEFAGDHTHLAKMLNIQIQLAYVWKKQGYISKKGAALVEQNPRLAKKFPSVYLRPDIKDL